MWQAALERDGAVSGDAASMREQDSASVGPVGEPGISAWQAEDAGIAAEPMKRLLLAEVMPHLSAAMLAAAAQHPSDPVDFIAHRLLQVSYIVRVPS